LLQGDDTLPVDYEKLGPDARENLKRLMDESQKIDAGFVLDGMGKIEGSNLVSLGSVSSLPLWVFYRGNETLAA